MRKIQTILTIMLVAMCIVAQAQTGSKKKAAKQQTQFTEPVMPPASKDDNSNNSPQEISNNPESNDYKTDSSTIFRMADVSLLYNLNAYTDTCMATGQKPFLLKHFNRHLDNHVDLSPLTHENTMYSVVYTFDKEKYAADFTPAPNAPYVYPCDFIISVDAKERTGLGTTPFFQDPDHKEHRVYILR